MAGAARNGDLVLKLGGAGDVLLAVDRPLTDPRLFIDFHVTPGLYFSNGCMAASCSVLNWIVREMAGGMGDAAARAGKSVHALLDDRAAALPPGADGVLLLPYFLGEKTPLHDPNARGTLVGLGLHHGLHHIWRAALEGVVFGFRHHVEVWRERDVEIGRVFACDGGAASDLWLQIAADVLARPIQRIDRHPGSSLGAAYVAGFAVGAVHDLAAIDRYVGAGRVFEPDAERSESYDLVYASYRELYDRLRTFYPKLGRGGGR